MIHPLHHSLGGPIYAHLSEERLAALAAGEALDLAAEGHLAGCRRCAGLYAELVRLRTEELVGPPEAPEEILEAGLGFVRERMGSGAPTDTTGRRRRWAAKMRTFSFVPSLALIALVLVVVLRSPQDVSIPTVTLPMEIRSALITDGASGMVHPLVLDAASFEAPILRGPVPSDPALKQSVQAVRDVYLADPEALPSAIALISAYQAADELASARAYLERALGNDPEDVTLRDLEIVQLYREGRFDLAERALRTRLDTEPDNLFLTVNLLILLGERGDPADHDEILQLEQQIRRREGGSPLARRAHRVLG